MNTNVNTETANQISNPIKLSFTRPRFTTNGNKITCTLEYKVCNQDRYKYLSVISFNSLGLRKAAVGEAVCSPNDKFDKKTGRRIAQARAEAAAYCDVRNAARQHRLNLLRALDESEDFITRADRIISHNKDFVNVQSDIATKK